MLFEELESWRVDVAFGRDSHDIGLESQEKCCGQLRSQLFNND